MRINSRVITSAIILSLFVGIVIAVSMPCQAASSQIVAIDAGLDYSIALYDNGTVWGWGENHIGIIGQADVLRVYTPLQIPIDNVVAISAGSGYVLALKNDGTVWGWGDNHYGNLGDGAPETSSTPVRINGLSDVKAIAAGGGHCLALKNDGTVRAWGRGFCGQLGIGIMGSVGSDGPTDQVMVSTPVQVDITDVIAISAGTFHSAALRGDGTVWSWGENAGGELGDGTHETRAVPVKTMIDGVKAISCGIDFTLAVKEDGTVWGWGDNTYLQLGNWSESVYQAVPVRVDGIKNIDTVAGGGSSSYAIDSDGTVWAWGNSDNGMLGNGITTCLTVNRPVKVTGLEHALLVAAGYHHALAVREDGSVWAWGRGDHGQLGIGIVPEYPAWSGSIAQQVLIGPSVEPIRATPVPPDVNVADDRDDSGVPVIGDGTGSLALDLWSLGISAPIQSFGVGDDGSLYAFCGNTIYKAGDGRIAWNLTIPEKWSVCVARDRPLNLGSGIGSRDIDTRPEPIYDTDDGYLFVYVTPPDEGTPDIYGNRHDNKHESDVIAISPDGNIAWTFPLPSSANVIDDTAIEAAGGQVYVFHGYNETVLDDNGTVLFTIRNVSSPAAVDGKGNLYVTSAVKRVWRDDAVMVGSGVAVHGDYRMPGSLVQAYGPDGGLLWSRDVGERVVRPFISENIRSGYGTLPICRADLLYVPVASGMIVYDTAGNEQWARHMDDGTYNLFELMPVDGQGNVYLKADNATGDARHSDLYIIENKGEDVSGPHKYTSEYGPFSLTAAQDGIIYNVIPVYAAEDGDQLTLDALDTYVIFAHDIKNDTRLWSYMLPVDNRHTTTVDKNILYGALINRDSQEYSSRVSGLAPGQMCPPLVKDLAPGSQYMPVGVAYQPFVDIYPAGDTIYVNFRSVTFEYPVVTNRSKCTYVSDVFAIRKNGEILYNSPVDQPDVFMSANNSTVFFLGGDGKITSLAIGTAVVAGIAFLGALAIASKFLLAGTIARARNRPDKNANRAVVMEYVVRHPGHTSYDIARGLSMNHGTIRYHLLTLHINHRVATFRDDTKFVRYFPNSGRYSKEDQLIIALMRRESMGNVLRALIDSPEMTNVEISRALDIPESITNRCLKELTAKGVVQKEVRRENKIIYFIPGARRPFISNLFGSINV